MTKSDVPAPHSFSHINTWVFDLDNTLYPHHTNLFSQIDVKMTDYVSKLLQLPRDEARTLQKKFYLEHGTTLNGLMIHHKIDPDDFLEQVHDIDYTWLKPDPKLGEAIRALPGRRFIFTNGNRKHAERAAAQLGILDHFEDVFDIVAADLTPKPARYTYDKFVSKHDIVGEKSVMFEDLARNLVEPKALGMKTVLVLPNNFEATFVEAWEHVGHDDEYIDHKTDDLAGFLAGLLL
jgi:putative hydrolase of the HAD superfamily